MKHTLSYIIALVTAAFIITLYQLHWLTDLYGTLHREVRSEVKQAIYRADVKETRNRLRIWNFRQRKSNKGGYLTFSFNYNNQSGLDNLTDSKNYYVEGKVFVEQSISDLERESDSLGMFMHQGLHSWLDFQLPVDRNFLDSCLTQELRGIGIKGAHRLFSRELLLTLWGDDSFFNFRSLHIFITKLRHKLSGDASVRFINVRGIGYRLVVEK